VLLVLLWGKGVGGLEVRGVCEGRRLKGEERKKARGDGWCWCWCGGLGGGDGGMVDRFGKHHTSFARIGGKICQDDVHIENKLAENQKTPLF